MTPEPRQDLPLPLPVEVERADGSRAVEYAVNVSPGGLCLHMREPLKVGEEIRIAFTLPPSGPRVEASASVIWSNWEGAPGSRRRFCETGVHFTDLDEDFRKKLSRYASQPLRRRR